MTTTDAQRLSWGSLARERLTGLTSLHGIVSERVAKQESADEALRQSVERAGREATEESEALSTLKQASEEAARKAKLVALKIETQHLEGALSAEALASAMTAAFPSGAGAVGAHPGERYNGLRRVGSVLEAKPELDRDGDLRRLVSEAARTLEVANEAAKKEAAERHEAYKALDEARARWDECYLATKEIVSGLLRDAGRRGEMAAFFGDLAGHTKR